MLPAIDVLMIGTLFVGKAANKKDICETKMTEIKNQFAIITMKR